MVNLTDALNDVVAGAVAQPGEPGWDEARRAWNLAADQNPAAVVEAASADDVAAVVAFARRHGLRVAPQSTGHGAVPLDPLDDAVLLKTSRMREVTVDPAARVARVEAGAVAEDVATAAAPHGLAAVSGFAPSVGIAGLTLSGGIGWLSRRHGLAANNVRAIELVTADGELRRVDAENEPDVFWALRGGGGNFGVVTALELGLHPVPETVAARMVWPAHRTGEVIARYAAWTRDLPEAMSSMLRYIPIPTGPIVTIVALYLGTQADAERLLHPLRSSTGLLVDTVEPVEPAAIVRVAGDPEQPGPSLAQGTLIRDLEPDLVEFLGDRIAGDAHKPLAVLELRQLGGALARVPDRPGALGSLDGAFSAVAGGPVFDPSMRAPVTQALRDFHDELQPWVTRPLLNFSNLRADTAAAFSDGAWAELRRVRATVDPDGMFLANHPITIGA